MIAMARHILVKQKEDAEKLRQRLLKGEDFDVLAKKHSTCNSAKKGGDLGEIRKGQLVKPVEQVIFKKPVKQVHGPVKSQFGFHLIEVYYRD
jgi:peptidyl-prolyl cis-trans isomerase C